MSDTAWPHFKQEEFAEASPSCSFLSMDNEFMMLVENARNIAGIPFHINSAYRSPEYDKAKGRPGTSYHCQGRAIDIRCTDCVSRAKIIQAAIKVGLKGIGIGPTFIHLDNRRTPCVWSYYDQYYPTIEQGYE